MAAGRSGRRIDTVSGAAHYLRGNRADPFGVNSEDGARSHCGEVKRRAQGPNCLSGCRGAFSSGVRSEGRGWWESRQATR